MKAPLVTIVTPVFNQAGFVARTIESVLSQSYSNFEYIVINDGSTDDLAPVVSRFRGKLNYREHSNKGQAETLNIGWNMAKGEIIGYLSADDLLHPTSVQRAVDILASDPGAILVFPDFHIIDPADRVIKTFRAGEFDFLRMVCSMDCRIGPGALFRKSVFEAAGGWDSSYRLIPDLEFWCRIGHLGRVAHIQEPLASFRMHPGSTTFANTSAMVAGEYSRLAESLLGREELIPILARHAPVIRAHGFLSDARTDLRAGRFGAAWKKIRLARAEPGSGLNWLAGLWMLVKAALGRTLHQLAWTLRGMAAKRSA